MDSKNIVLNVNGIEVIYNHVILVLKGVSLQVPEGGIVAILGGNGAGKTTTLRATQVAHQTQRTEGPRSRPAQRTPCSGLGPATGVVPLGGWRRRRLRGAFIYFGLDSLSPTCTGLLTCITST